MTQAFMESARGGVDRRPPDVAFDRTRRLAAFPPYAGPALRSFYSHSPQPPRDERSNPPAPAPVLPLSPLPAQWGPPPVGGRPRRRIAIWIAAAGLAAAVTIAVAAGLTSGHRGGHHAVPSPSCSQLAR